MRRGLGSLTLAVALASSVATSEERPGELVQASSSRMGVTLAAGESASWDVTVATEWTGGVDLSVTGSCELDGDVAAVLAVSLGIGGVYAVTADDANQFRDFEADVDPGVAYRVTLTHLGGDPFDVSFRATASVRTETDAPALAVSLDEVIDDTGG